MGNQAPPKEQARCTHDEKGQKGKGKKNNEKEHETKS
jgi:hypothetical protein